MITSGVFHRIRLEFVAGVLMIIRTFYRAERRSLINVANWVFASTDRIYREAAKVRRREDNQMGKAQRLCFSSRLRGSSSLAGWKEEKFFPGRWHLIA